MSREQKGGVLHEKLQILRSVTHSHAVIFIFVSPVCQDCFVLHFIYSSFFGRTIDLLAACTVRGLHLRMKG